MATTTQDFIRRVISTEGYPCVWNLSDKSNVLFKTRTAMAKYIEKHAEEEEGLYFSLATYKEYGEASAENPVLKGYRITSKVSGYKALFTEIDVRSERSKDCYRTIEKAREAIDAFCADVQIPYPTIVSTGGGFHLYWTLQDDITIKQWRLWSKTIIAVAQCWGLLIDVAGTNKPTQIFRPVGTLNRKYDPPHPVEVVDIIRADVQYDRIMEAMELYLAKNDVPKIIDNIRDTAITKTDVDLRDFDQIQGQCEQIVTAPFGSEEHWRGMLTITRLCMEANKHAHIMSSMDERYDPAMLDEKLNTLDKQMEGTDGMPFTCEKFNEVNPDVCHKCPYYKTIKSPIVLGIRDISLTETMANDISDLPTLQGEVKVPEKKDVQEVSFHTPEGGIFKVTEKGLVMKEAVEKNGEIEWEEVIICKQRLYPIGVILDKDDYGNQVFSYLWRIELDNGKENDAIIPADMFVSPTALMGVFASLGVNVIKASHFKVFAQAMRAFITSVRDTIPPIMVHHSLGWKTEEFVVGTRTIDSDGNARRSILNPEMETLVRDVMCEGGTYIGWQQAVEPYTSKSMILEQCVLATSFAAPLIQHSTVNGMMFSLQGASGCGKSTMQKIAASVWGNPSAQLQNSVGTKTGDTIISATRWIGGLNNLPVHLEELSNMSDQDASDLAYMITQGSEKNRMQGLKDGGFKRSVGLTWKTMVVSSSNEAICDKIARFKVDSHAELMRILEIRDIPPINQDWYEVGNTLEGVNQNFGHAGLEYAKYLQLNQGNLRGWLKDEVNIINKDMDTTSPERFWVQGIATILLGARLATSLGIFNFNIKAMRKYLYKQIAAHRLTTYSVSTVKQSLFADMLNAMLGETLVVRSSEIQGVGVDVVRLPLTRLGIRIDTSLGEMWISRKSIGAYSKKEKISTNMILNNAKADGFIIIDDNIRSRLGTGAMELGDERIQTRSVHLQIPNNKVDEIAN